MLLIACGLGSLQCQILKPVLFLQMVKTLLHPAYCLKSGFYPSHVNFCKSVENVKLTSVERANMLQDA